MEGLPDPPLPPRQPRPNVSSGKSGRDRDKENAPSQPVRPPTARGGGGDLKEQIQNQKGKLRKAPEASRMAPKGLQSPANPSDLRSVLNKAFKDRFQHAVGEGEDTSQSTTNQEITWS